MVQYTSREFIKIVQANGYYLDRSSGDHAVYINSQGRHISIPLNDLKCVIARRLIRENSLITDIKKAKKVCKKE